MPAVLLPSMDNAYRVIVVAVCAGLVSDAYVVGPIFGVAVLLAAPVVVGLFVGLLGCEAPVGEYIAVLLAVYATFVFLSARRMCGLSYQRLLDRAVVQEQSETIGLLLKDFEEGTSDWLWETDAAGRLRNSRRRFAAFSAGTPRSCATSRSWRCCASSPRKEPRAGKSRRSSRRRGPPAVPGSHRQLRTTEGTRWWTLNGKPAFDRRGAFIGYRGVGSDVPRAERRRPASPSLRGTTP